MSSVWVCVEDLGMDRVCLGWRHVEGVGICGGSWYVEYVVVCVKGTDMWRFAHVECISYVEGLYKWRF